MFRRPIEPHGTAGGPLTPWIVLAAAWSAIAGIWLAWAAGRLTAAVLGRPATGPDFGADFFADLVRADWAALWPGVNPILVAVIYAVLVTVTFGGVWYLWTRWLDGRPAGDDPLPSLADARAVASLTLPQVATRARRLRPSLAATPADLIPAGQAGVALGTHRTTGRFGLGRRNGATLYASLEDVIVAVMAPRSGKTTALTTPAILDAPGAVLATSNKPDVWTTTAEREGPGRHGVGVRPASHHPRTPNLVVEPAHPDHHLGGGVPARRPLRQPDPQQTPVAAKTSGPSPPRTCSTCFILAAACEHGTLADVQAGCPTSPPANPPGILSQHGFHGAARSVAGRQAGAPETRDGVYETARTAASCLSDPRIMAWVTPPTTPLPTLDVEKLPESHRHAVPAVQRRRRIRRTRSSPASPTRSCAPPSGPPRCAADASTRPCWPSSTKPRTSAKSLTCPSCSHQRRNSSPRWREVLRLKRNTNSLR